MLRHGKTQQVDVVENQRRQPGHIFRPHEEALSAELFQRRIDVESVPEDDIHHETKRANLVFLPFPVALA